MIIDNIIQNVQSQYSKGVHSTSTRLAPRHIYSACMIARETVLVQQANKKQEISIWNYQTLPCVEMEPQKINPLMSTATVLRSKCRIPRVMSSLEKPLFKSITSIDGYTTFDKSTFSTDKYSDGNKYTANKPAIYIHDGYLYMTGYKYIQAISITALFSDPLEAAMFPSLCEDDCDKCKSAFEYDFYLDGRMEQAVIDIVIPKLVVAFGQAREDKLNNASDDTAGQANYRQQNERE